MGDDEEALRVTLTHIRFHRDNFLIGVVSVAKEDTGEAGALDLAGDPPSIKGNMITPAIGMVYELRGTWTTHPRFGRQFNFTWYKAAVPVDVWAISLYLQEHAKGIGPALADKIVKKYGTDSLLILKANPGMVATEIDGLSASAAHKVAEHLLSIEKDEAVELEVKDLLAGTKTSKWQTRQVIKKWGHEAPAVIRDNPYRLTAVSGIGFPTADSVAIKNGFDLESPPRVHAGVGWYLGGMESREGSTCCESTELAVQVSELLNLDESYVGGIIETMVTEKRLIAHQRGAAWWIYRVATYGAENAIAERLSVMTSFGSNPLRCDESVLVGLQGDQRSAVEVVATSPVTVITGAPGTGKTHTVRALLKLFYGRSIALAAPTGKAAKRMTELTNYPASTIHRLLGTIREGGEWTFEHHSLNPLRTSVIVLDEASMIDIKLMASFLDAVGPGTRLVLVGDSYQLPSVGPGNVLRDIIESGVVPSVELKTIKRQDAGDIIGACHAIKAGEVPGIDNDSTQDLFMFGAKDQTKAIQVIKSLVTDKLAKRFGADLRRDVQFITPLRERTDLAVAPMNLRMQAWLNPDGEKVGKKFRVGDKVIQLKNDYELDILNGDVGIVIGKADDKHMTVKFENPQKNVKIRLSGNDLDLAYAITAHKAQGSEYPIVVIPMSMGFTGMVFNRPWLYTAISRAQKVCVLVGTRDCITSVVERVPQANRRSNLDQMLKIKQETIDVDQAQGQQAVRRSPEALPVRPPEDEGDALGF